MTTSIPATFGSELADTDYKALGSRWITPEGADQAGIRRVDSSVGRDMFGRKQGDLAGLIIPNVFPGESHIREYRLRRDHPDLEYRADGSFREANKYIQPSQRSNLLYFPPGTPAALLADASIPIVVTEGEFKALALWRLARHDSTSPKFMPMSVAGVWNWRGTVGKTTGPKGDRRDVKGVISDFDRIVCKGRQVVIAFDADCESNPKVTAARRALAAMLIDRGATVGFLEWPSEEGKGIDDRLAMVGPDKVLADIDRVEFGDWHTRLLRNDKGKLLSCYDNAALFLENSPEWEGVLGYNDFTGAHVVLKQPPTPVSAKPGDELDDHFDTEAVRWLERHGVMVKPDAVRRVIDAAARRNSFHPVREYLESLPKWDGVPRIRTWLLDYCRVASSDTKPNHYAMAVGEKFLISAIARIFEPGCKADHMLVLEGPQGVGKSTVVRILAGDWFVDQLAEPGSKDASMQLRGSWLFELSELGALNRTEMERTKAFITQQFERFRPPYGRRLVEMPRQCIFIGTTNSETWLKDETGGRRFWPVWCGGPIDLAALRRDRDQLWAEALLRYRQGVTWWLEDPEVIEDAIEQQRGRYQEDVWQPLVEAYAIEESCTREYPDRRGSVSIHEILCRLGVETARQDQAATNRVARCLKAANWERFRQRTGDILEWRYRKAAPK
jgi:predicted P-loop ATPase